jgi:hypothetical protein
MNKRVAQLSAISRAEMHGSIGANLFNISTNGTIGDKAMSVMSELKGSSDSKFGHL